MLQHVFRISDRLLEGGVNRRRLKEARSRLAFAQKPLVSVIIPTFQNSRILVERTLPSVLRQSYVDFEVVIVGDGCSPEHVERIESFLAERNESRFRFENLAERGVYPSNPHHRWLVAGEKPANRGIELARGDWIAPLDDDDEFTSDHIETLLGFALSGGYEFVYGIVSMEQTDGDWVNVGSAPLERAKISHLAVLYHRRLGFFRYDINAWKMGEPADWNMWRRMKEAGARVGFVPKLVGCHYREKERLGQ